MHDFADSDESLVQAAGQGDLAAFNQRMAIVLRYYEDLNYAEIATAMETTSKAVERLLGRGRKRLKALLGKTL